jgi:hypothetical protein
LEGCGCGIEGDLEAVGCKWLQVLGNGPGELARSVGDISSNHGTELQGCGSRALKECDGDGLAVELGRWLPDDVQGGSCGYILILGWGSDGIKAWGLGEDGGSHGQNGRGDEGVTHVEEDVCMIENRSTIVGVPKIQETREEARRGKMEG